MKSWIRLGMALFTAMSLSVGSLHAAGSDGSNDKEVDKVAGELAMDDNFNYIYPNDSDKKDKAIPGPFKEADEVAANASSSSNDSKSGSDSDKTQLKHSYVGEGDFPGKATYIDDEGKERKSRYEWIFNDNSYSYYMDLNSSRWIRVPYSASEYMIDVWICLVPTSVDSYVEEYDDDGNVTSHYRKYYMEHYYVWPKKQQIQFLCELEVAGRPQNTISEREYRVKNWESLIPGSIEDEIYRAVVKRMGKSREAKGGMGFFEMLDEYARISL